MRSQELNMWYRYQVYYYFFSFTFEFKFFLNKQEKELFKKKNDGTEQRKENVLCAVLALVKELDYNELEFIKRDIDRRLGFLFSQNIHVYIYS